MAPGYVVGLLDKTHDRAAFTCGVEPLDRYLKQQARQDMERNVVRVFVLCPQDSTTIAGYYTLSATAIKPTNLPSDLVRRLPRYPTVPAILIGRLAADTRYQGHGVGKHLLLSALRRSLHLSTDLGAVAVVVDAKDATAQAFYERYGFLRFIDDPYRLFLPLTTITQLFPPDQPRVV